MARCVSRELALPTKSSGMSPEPWTFAARSSNLQRLDWEKHALGRGHADAAPQRGSLLRHAVLRALTVHVVLPMRYKGWRCALTFYDTPAFVKGVTHAFGGHRRATRCPRRRRTVDKRDSGTLPAYTAPARGPRHLRHGAWPRRTD